MWTQDGPSATQHRAVTAKSSHRQVVGDRTRYSSSTGHGGRQRRDVLKGSVAELLLPVLKLCGITYLRLTLNTSETLAKEEEMRTPLFLRAARRKMRRTATTGLRVPASLCALKGQTVALPRRAGRVWLWALVSVAAPVVAAEVASVTVEREVHALVNEHRRALGLQPLASNEESARQARCHSQAMARGRGGVDHHGAEERREALLQRIGFTACAENVAAK